MSAVHGKKFYGYQGFVPTHLVHPPSMKNGETYEFLREKYGSVGQGQVYKELVKSGTMNFDNKTLVGDQMATVKSSDYKIPDRRGVAAFHDSADVSARSKPFYGSTMYNSTFRNFSTEGRLILSLNDASDLKDAFDRHCDSKGELSLKRIQAWLSDAVGSSVPDWITSKFLKSFDANPTGRFTWDEVEAAYPSIVTSIRNDVTKQGTSQPEWLTASKKMPPKVLTNSGVKSAMQLAMQHPSERKYKYKTGMWSCDEDMLAGTTRDTYHIPGYSGHIPMSKRNPVVSEQGDAKVPRPIKNNLRLIYSHDLPGYTGHQPHAARNDIGEKKGGRDPRTTSGSAAVGQDIL